MKIMTINTHSYIEDDADKKLDIFIDATMRIKPDIIAMQEVNQRVDEPFFDKDENIGANCGISLKNNNFALRALKRINKENDYKLFWLGIKRGFEVFDEGLCFLSKIPPDDYKTFLLSETDDEKNWKKRMALGIKIKGEWFYNVHFSRWDDEEEPFYNQWKKFKNNISSNETTWVMGDFNAPSNLKCEGYKLVLAGGFYDTYTLAKNKDDGYTAKKAIDGWLDKSKSNEKMRIDYIFTNTKREIESSYLVFNGKTEEIISDHFGIILSY